MLAANAYENSGPEGHGVLEVAPGDAATRRLFVPLQHSELHGMLAGPLASLALTQVFRFGADATQGKAIEALYRFPLPGDAAVTGVTVRFGEVVIEAHLAERAAAEKEYADAKAEGRQAALVTRESAAVFTLNVTGLVPDQDVAVTTHYVQLALAEGPGWSLRLPLTTPPRYTRGDEDLEAQNPLGILRDPGHRFKLDVTIQGAAAASASLPLATTAVGDDLHVTLKAGAVLPDRDLVLTWRPHQVADKVTLAASRFDDLTRGDAYVLAQVAPPTQPAQRVPREVTVLVDHSGSMGGSKWAAADWAVQLFLRDLGPADHFALGLFEDKTLWYKDDYVAATPEHVESAIKFLLQTLDSGGTELGVALEQALTMQRADGERARHVLLITDAQVTDEGRLLRLLEQEHGRADRQRVSLLCIDAAPNSYLVYELAAAGNGVARFLTSEASEGDVTTALENLLADWSAPLCAELRLGVNLPGAQGATRNARTDAPAGTSQLDLGDLPAGRSVWVVARVPQAAGKPLSLEVTDGTGKQWATLQGVSDTDGAGRQSATLQSLGDTGQLGAALRAIFGARRLMGLEHLISSYREGPELEAALERLGYEAETAKLSAGTSVYAENAKAAAQAALKPLLVAESLAYGIASSETAFVATRSEAGRPIAGTVVVASALPAGWNGYGAPTGGGGAPGGAVRFGASMRTRSAGALPPPMPAAAPAPKKSLFARPSRDDGAAVPDVAVPAFSGTPTWEGTQAVLFAGTGGDGSVPQQLTSLAVTFPDGWPAGLDGELVLALYVDDLASPRARVKLVDLARMGGRRPLNLAVPEGALVKLVLEDPAGAWAAGAPAFEVSLG